MVCVRTSPIGSGAAGVSRARPRSAFAGDRGGRGRVRPALGRGFVCGAHSDRGQRGQTRACAVRDAFRCSTRGRRARLTPAAPLPIGEVRTQTMALRGNLSDFSLPDVFQLVQLSRKTGVLRIRKDCGEGSVWFREGDVFFAQSNWHRELLGHRLVAAGRITTAALAKALEIRRSEPAGGRRLGAILVDEGYIGQNVLEAFVQEQIQDTIFDLMRWDNGAFEFEVLPEALDEDIGLTVSIENIVMEGS